MLALYGPIEEAKAFVASRLGARFPDMIGADVVGISTVPEVAEVEKIIATANSVEPKLRALVKSVLVHQVAKK